MEDRADPVAAAEVVLEPRWRQGVDVAAKFLTQPSPLSSNCWTGPTSFIFLFIIYLLLDYWA
jgi:hypothetical protein